MSHKTFLLTRASGAEMNAAQFGNLSTMFASAAASKSSLTLLVTKEDGDIRDYLHIDETAIPGNAHLTLAQVVGASGGARSERWGRSCLLLREGCLRFRD